MSIISDPVLINSGISSQHYSGILKTESNPHIEASAVLPHPNNESYMNNGHHSPLPNGNYNNNGLNICEPQGSEEVQADETPPVDIFINNVVCTFSVRCHLNLKRIAMEGCHVEYKRENGMLNMKLRRPNATATIWSSGKITCTGSTSEFEAKIAARKIARRIQKLGFNTRFGSYRVVNVLGTCAFHFGIKLNQFSNEHKHASSYEPELHPGVTYKIKEPKATLKIFSTGSITVTAPCVQNVQLAIEHIYPLVEPFKMERTKLSRKELVREKKFLKKSGVSTLSDPVLDMLSESEEEYFDEEELEDSEFDSDVSCD